MKWAASGIPWSSVFLIGFASLAYEVLLIRVFSIVHWHHFVAMAIGLALLGHGASGAFIAIFQQRLLKHFHSVFVLNLLAFAVISPLGFYITQIVQFNSLEVVWDITQWWRLLIIELVLMLPFFFAANAIGLSICHFKQRLSLIYGTELLGAGLGAISLIVLLHFVSLIHILLVIMCLAGLASLLALRFVQQSTRRLLALASVCLMSLVFLLAGTGHWPKLEVAHYKALHFAQQLPNTDTVYEQSTPQGLITVLASPTVPLRMASGISLNFQGDIPEQLGLYIDGESIGGLTKYDGDTETIKYLDAAASALSYRLVGQQAEILLVGLGAGDTLLQASMHQPARVDVVETNAQVIGLFTEHFKEFSGAAHLSPFTSFNRADIRGWLQRENVQYDLIQIQSMEGRHANVLSLREQYRLSKEALRSYWRALKKEGILSITLWLDIPPRIAPRVVNTIYDMLSELEVDGADIKGAEHLAVIRSWQAVSILLSKSTVSESRIEQIKLFSDRHHFDLVYYPGINPRQANQFNRLQAPYYYQLISGLLDENRRKAILDNYTFDLSATSDDQPFFYHFLKVDQLADLLSLWRRGGESMLPQGYLILWISLAQALLLSLVLIALPLYCLKRRFIRRTLASNSLVNPFSTTEQGRLLLYFCLIGFAFFMVELAMVERFTLFLSHPAITGATIIGSFLIFSGMGSLFSHRMKQTRSGRYVAHVAVFGLILLCGLAYLLILPWLFEGFAHVGLGIKVVMSFCILSPLAFLMGMPFPLGLKHIDQCKGAVYLPWVWGINGCASVMSINLATLLAVHFGFTFVLLLGMTLYLSAAFALKQSS